MDSCEVLTNVEEETPSSIATALKKASNLLEVTSENVGISAQFKSLKDEVRAAKLETDREAKNGKALEQMVRNKDAELGRMQKKVDEVVALKRHNVELENDCLDLRRQLNEAQAEIKSCQLVIRTRDSSIQQLNTKLEQEQEALRANLEELADMSAKLKASQKMLTDLGREISVQRDELIRTSQVAAKVAASQVKSGNKDEGTVPVTQHLGDIKYMQGEISRLKEKVASLEKQLRVSDELKEHFKTIAQSQTFDGAENGGLTSSIRTLRTRNQPAPQNLSNPLYQGLGDQNGIGRRPGTAPPANKRAPNSPAKPATNGACKGALNGSRPASAATTPVASRKTLSEGGLQGGAKKVGPNCKSTGGSVPTSANTTPDPAKQGPTNAWLSPVLHTKVWGSHTSRNQQVKESPRRPASAPHVKASSKIAAYIHAPPSTMRQNMSKTAQPTTRAQGRTSIPSPMNASKVAAPAAKEVTHKEMTHKEVAHKEVTHEEVAHKEVAHKEVADKEVDDNDAAGNEDAGSGMPVPVDDLPPEAALEAVALANSDDEA